MFAEVSLAQQVKGSALSITVLHRAHSIYPLTILDPPICAFFISDKAVDIWRRKLRTTERVHAGAPVFLMFAILKHRIFTVSRVCVRFPHVHTAGHHHFRVWSFGTKAPLLEAIAWSRYAWPHCLAVQHPWYLPVHLSPSKVQTGPSAMWK